MEQITTMGFPQKCNWLATCMYMYLMKQAILTIRGHYWMSCHVTPSICGLTWFYNFCPHLIPKEETNNKILNVRNWVAIYIYFLGFNMTLYTAILSSTLLSRSNRTTTWIEHYQMDISKNVSFHDAFNPIFMHYGQNSYNNIKVTNLQQAPRENLKL
jgi:hypothetical protein